MHVSLHKFLSTNKFFSGHFKKKKLKWNSRLSLKKSLHLILFRLFVTIDLKSVCVELRKGGAVCFQTTAVATASGCCCCCGVCWSSSGLNFLVAGSCSCCSGSSVWPSGVAGRFPVSCSVSVGWMDGGGDNELSLSDTLTEEIWNWLNGFKILSFKLERHRPYAPLCN